MMQDLRNEITGKKPVYVGGTNKPNFLIRTIMFLWDYRWWIIGIFTLIITLNIIFNPINTATTLANWVNDFVGTFLKALEL